MLSLYQQSQYLFIVSARPILNRVKHPQDYFRQMMRASEFLISVLALLLLNANVAKSDEEGANWKVKLQVQKIEFFSVIFIKENSFLEIVTKFHTFAVYSQASEKENVFQKFITNSILYFPFILP